MKQGGRGFGHRPKSKVAFDALASGSAGCRHGTRPKLAEPRDAAGMVAPSHRHASPPPGDPHGERNPQQGLRRDHAGDQRPALRERHPDIGG